MFQNTNRNSISFLLEAGIQPGSEEHKDLKITVQKLWRQYFHPYKYVEEQAPDRVEQLVAKARSLLPWLVKYEDCWPARVYLKRYVDARRPHLQTTRYALRKKGKEVKSQASRNKCSRVIRNPRVPSNMPGDHDPVVKKFLSSLVPNLEHCLDAFAKLGVKDQKSLEAFLSWPQVAQSQFLDEGHGVLQLTSLEKQGLLLECGQLAHRVLRGALTSILKTEPFYP